MKRIIRILFAIVVLLLITFLLQNWFLLGVPFVEKDKTTGADLDRLLGKRYLEYFESSGPPGFSGRKYFVHCGSYIFSIYYLSLFGPDNDSPKKKVMYVAWYTKLDWEEQRALEDVDSHAKGR